MVINLATIDFCPGQGGGVNPSGTLDITSNGEYDVYSYASASVSVHPSSSLSETYTSNSVYQISGEFNGGEITVEVPAPQFITETLNVSANNTYYPGSGVNGFSEVVVNVPQSVTGFTEKEITEGVQISNLSNSASYVHSYGFINTYLQTISLPNCTSVGEMAFTSCYSLQTVDIQNCTTIYRQGFAYCSSLSYINIPNCISLSGEAFRRCTNLQIIDLPVIKEISGSVFTDCFSLSYVNISNYSNEIFDNTFYACSNLQSIDIHNVHIINNNAFTNCKKLEYVNADIGYIGYQTFGNCGFSEINLSNVYFIGGNAFNGCSSLTTVSLNMTNYIWFSYDNMFNNCSNIVSIYVQSWLYDRYVSAAGWSSFADKFISVPVPSMLSYSDGWLTGATKALDYYFNSQIGCSYMSVISVSLPNCEDMLWKIGTKPKQYPLRNECKNMTYLSLGSLSIAPESLMSGHQKIQEVYFPICNGLEKDVFRGCSSLTTVSLPMCEYIGDGAFGRCVNLQSIDLPVCSYIDSKAFEYCMSLTTVSLPMCEYIGNGAFYACSNLQSIDLPVCSYIGNLEFVNAVILDTVILRSNSVCVLDGNAFQGTRIDSRNSDGFVYVPASLVDAYKSATNWSSIASKILPIE